MKATVVQVGGAGGVGEEVEEEQKEEEEEGRQRSGEEGQRWSGEGEAWREALGAEGDVLQQTGCPRRRGVHLPSTETGNLEARWGLWVVTRVPSCCELCEPVCFVLQARVGRVQEA